MAETPAGVNKEEKTGSSLIVLFLLVPIGAIVGLIYVVQRLFFSSEELARFDVSRGNGEGTLQANANDELDVRIDIRADREISDANFGQQLSRGDLRLTLTAPDGTTQTARCDLYNGWTETTHSRERLRRPFYEGAQNDCKLRAHESGTHRLRAQADWHDAQVRSALVRVLK